MEITNLDREQSVSARLNQSLVIKLVEKKEGCKEMWGTKSLTVRGQKMLFKINKEIKIYAFELKQ